MDPTLPVQPPAPNGQQASPQDALGLGSFNGVVPGFSTDAQGNILTAGGGTRQGGYFPNGAGIVPGGNPNPFLPTPPAQAPNTPPPPPNLNDIINTFPGVNDSLALEQMGIGQLDANLNQARQRAVINFGDPALAQMAGFGMDPQAGAFARQNYLSGNATLARIDKAHQQAAQAIINQLASHGILNSGDLGYKEGQENQGYGNTVYDAQQGVLGQLADLFNNYLSSRYGLEQNANSSKLQALQSFLANPDAYATLFNGASGSGATAPQPGATVSPSKATKGKAAPAAAMRKALGNSQAAFA